MAKARFAIELLPRARKELDAYRAFDQRQIISAIESQLCHEPLVATRNRKPLADVKAAFDFNPPLWELRIGEYRTFYDVNVAKMTVIVRSIRHKPLGTTTAEVLQ